MGLTDWIIVAILLVSVLSAFRQGFFVASLSFVGLLAGLLLASWNYQRLMPIVGKFLHSDAAVEVTSFLLIAIAVMVLCGIAGRLLRSLFHMIGLGWADRIMGAFFGLLRGAVIVTLGVMAIAAFLPHLRWFDDSRLAHYFLNAAHQSAAVTPAELGEKIRSGVRTIREAQPDWLRPRA
jgi:membrane protein required for colicin V production